MTAFFKNKIFLDSETIAERLRRARQVRGLKIKDVAEELKINIKYLEAIEKNQLNKLPKGIYAKKFLQEYALFLGVNPNEIIKIFEKEIVCKKNFKNLFEKKIIKYPKFLIISKVVRNFLIIIIAIICFFYLGLEIKKIVKPPEVFIVFPPENFITFNKNIEIIGITEKESEVFVNGSSVLTDVYGNFYKEVNLKLGLNTIVISVRKKYGSSKEIIRQIMVKEGDFKL